MGRRHCNVSLPDVRATRGKNVPAWAVQIAKKECTKKSLTLFWTEQKSRRRQNYVAGTAWSGGRVVGSYGEYSYLAGACVNIKAGSQTSQDYQLYVLLHELAHINVGAGHGHDRTWQREAVRLYAKYNLLDSAVANGWHGRYAVERKAVESRIRRRDGKKIAAQVA